jgi:hypothetical protein
MPFNSRSQGSILSENLYIDKTEQKDIQYFIFNPIRL